MPRCGMMMMSVIMVMSMLVAVFPGAVMLMIGILIVFMVMSFCRLMFFLTVHCHLHMGARDPAGGAFLRLQPDAGKPEPVHRIQKSLFILQQLIEGRHEHIPRCSHLTFYIKCPHRTYSSFIPSI